jgi:diaminohydroxyphosphoribosylaminopyrimidine deaminase / 5-amino-6-(5-phosphoribosylamino)uracil reductase
MNDDTHWMQLALLEAARGWHRASGQPHAEREALAAVSEARGKNAARGATIYITLEPCSTHGRTPPCTEGLIDAGISRVVYASVDRNPDHAGRADAILKSAGVEVVSGVCREQAEHLLRPFFKVRETGLPWVIWKTAMSLDGRITRPPGEGQWLTGEAARADVQVLRSTVDAILTSGETVRQDKPALTLRMPELLVGRPQPWRIVVTDRPETLPMDAPLFADSSRERTLIRSGKDLEEMLRGLAREQGVLTVMIEAGGVFSAAMLEAHLVDEVVAYYSPMLCGGPSLALAGHGLVEAMHLEEIEFTQLNDDVRLRGVIRR